MSSIAQQLKVAVFTALNVSAVTTLATGGVRNTVADETTNYPFVMFDIQGFSEVEYTFNFGQAVEKGLLIIKAYSDEDSDTTKGATDLNDEILEACQTILHAGITLSGDTLLYLRKHSDMPVIPEQLSDREVFGSGRMFKFAAN